jgi:hypothetical protein
MHGFRPAFTPGERAAIEVNAKSCDLTVSAYLRTVGSGYEPKSTLDQQAVGDLLRLNADQGRLGGLLIRSSGAKTRDSPFCSMWYA